MKKFWKIAALVLTVAILMSTVAAAAEISNKKATITVLDGVGASAAFDTSNEDIVKVSVTSASLKAGEQYLILMVKSSDGENYTIDKDSILYIDQKAADSSNTVAFDVYPSSYADSVILITGVADGALKVAIVDGKFIVGDANGDNKINAMDIIRIANYLVGNATVESGAADANGDGKVNAMDIIRIANYLVGNAALGQ